jgi:predicted kinase
VGTGTSGAIAVPLIVLVGIPGSGKSTWCRQFCADCPRYRVVSTDHIRATLYGDEAIQGDWPQIWARVLQEWQWGYKEIAAGNLDGLIYDATNARRRDRRAAIAVARQLGFAPIAIYWFDVPLALALARNQVRSRQVPTEVIERMYRQIEGAPPGVEEGVEQVVRLTGTDFPRPNFPSPLV